MKIYIAHSKRIDYQNELYAPIRKHFTSPQYEIILPHEKDDSSSNTREFYKNIDVLIAECSDVATGLGIELGWAYDDGKPIYVLSRAGSKISGSLQSVTKHFYEYHSEQEMISIIEEIIMKEM